MELLCHSVKSLNLTQVTLPVGFFLKKMPPLGSLQLWSMTYHAGCVGRPCAIPSKCSGKVPLRAGVAGGGPATTTVPAPQRRVSARSAHQQGPANDPTNRKDSSSSASSSLDTDLHAAECLGYVFLGNGVVQMPRKRTELWPSYENSREEALRLQLEVTPRQAPHGGNLVACMQTRDPDCKQ